MPRSFYPATGKPDGHYGEETVKTVWKFQASQRLPTDGQAGKDTLTCLDTIISTGWFGRLLEIGGVIAYELDRNLLRIPTPSIYGSDLAALRRECDQLRQILQRYGRRPAPRSEIIFAAMKKRPGDPGVNPVLGGAITATDPATGALQLLIVGLAAAAIAIAGQSVSNQPTPIPAPTPAPSPSPTLSGGAVTSAVASLLLVVAKLAISEIQTTIEKARADRDDVNKCWDRRGPAKPDQKEANSLRAPCLGNKQAFDEAFRKLVDRGTNLIGMLRANPRNEHNQTLADAFKGLKKDLDKALGELKNCLKCDQP